jgi:hypothetical protein
MTDPEVEAELRWIIEHGYRRIPKPRPLSNARQREMIEQMRAMRAKLGGPAAFKAAMIHIGEDMIQRSADA